MTAPQNEYIDLPPPAGLKGIPANGFDESKPNDYVLTQTRDWKPRFRGSIDQCMEWVHKHTSHSFSAAIEDQGYYVVPGATWDKAAALSKPVMGDSFAPR